MTETDPAAALAAKKAEHFAGMAQFAFSVDQVSRVMLVLDVGPDSGVVYEDGVLYVPADLAAAVAAIDPDDDTPQRLLAAAEARRALLRQPIETAHGLTWVDSGTRADIRETIAAIDAGAISEPVAFKLASGFVSASRADLVSLGQAIADHVAAAYAAEAAWL